MSTEDHVAICAKCNRTMSCEETGVTLEMQANGKPYYLIQADRYRCHGCGWAAYSEFGRPVYHYHEKFHETMENHPNRVRIT